MFKKLIIIFLFFGISFCFADEFEQEVIQGGIKYNEATARIAAFKDVEKKIDKKIIKEYLKDPNRKENIKAIIDGNYDIDFDIVLCPFYYRKTLKFLLI